MSESLQALALAREHRRGGRREAAVVALRQAAQLAAGDHDLLMAVGKEFMGLQLPADASRVLSAITQPTAESALAGAAAAGAAGDWGLAIRTLQHAAVGQGDDTRLWCALAQAASAQRDHALAVDAYARHVASLAEPPPTVLLHHARLLLAAHRLDDAAAVIERALARAPSAQAHHLAGTCARFQGDLDLARTHFRAAAALDVGFGSAWMALAELTAAEDLAALDEHCAAGLAASSDNGRQAIEQRFALGRIRDRRGLFDAAFVEIERANALHRALRERAGTHYQPARAEATVDLILRHFPALPSTVSRSASRRLIFIVGMPRSGTTLVERMLLGLEGVGSSRENEAMEFVAEDYYRAAADRAVDEAVLAALARQYWERTPCEAPVVIDKMPTNFFHVGVILTVFPDARIVHLRRDRYDVGWSIYSRFFGDGHPYACSLAHIAHFREQERRLMAHWRRLAPGAIHALDYEVLVRDPVTASRGLARFCALAWRDSCLAIENRRHVSFTFSELQVRERISDGGIGRSRPYASHLDPLARDEGTSAEY
jgi:tetratricopeptide (TPR) repeat protein